MNLNEEIRRVAAEAECLYSLAALHIELDRIAAEITTRLQESHPLVLCVLNGGIIPTGELITRLHFPLELDSIKAGRYQGRPGVANFTGYWNQACPCRIAPC